MLEAVLLAAGKGKRLGKIGKRKQKATFEIGEKSLLENNLFVLDKFCDRIYIVVGHRKNDVMMKVEEIKKKEKINAKIKFLYQEKRLGTANAIGLASSYIKKPFVVINGDILWKKSDLQAVISAKPNNVAVSHVDDPWNYGVVGLKGKYMQNIVEKPEKGKEPSNLVLSGLYYFTPKIFKAIKETPLSKKGEYWITDSMLLLIKKFGEKISVSEIKMPPHITTQEDFEKYKNLQK